MAIIRESDVPSTTPDACLRPETAAWRRLPDPPGSVAELAASRAEHRVGLVAVEAAGGWERLSSGLDSVS